MLAAMGHRQQRTDGDDGPWLHREDRGELLSWHQRSDGTLLVEGFAAREGIMQYRTPRGMVRELVTADVLESSAPGLARLAVTLEHPDPDRHPAGVTPDNVSSLGIGDTDGEVAVHDGGFTRVRIAVRRRDGISAVRAGKRELSPGYAVRIDTTPGTHPVYGAYDQRQTSRRYNHLAIVDKARGGSEVRLRADSAISTTVIRMDAEPNRGGRMNPRLIALLARLGVNQRVDSDDAAIDLAMDALNARKDAKDDAERQRADAMATAERTRDAEKVRADKAAADLVAANTAIATEKARADSATAELATFKAAEAARLDAVDRASLDSLCKRFRIDAAQHAKTADLKRAIAAAHLGGSLRADATDAYVDALVDIAKAGQPAGRVDGREAGRQVWEQPAGQRADAGQQTPAKKVSRWDAAFAAARK